VGSAAPSPPGSPVLVPVYYTTAEAGTHRLVREFHPAPAGSPQARVRSAVAQMFKPAKDPDYATLWPAGATVLSAEVAGEVVTVDLGGAAQNNLGAEGSRVAVQQLVWTVTAVSELTQVRILLDGTAATDLWGHEQIGSPLKRGNALGLLAFAWLISPQHGDQVGTEFTMHVAGIVSEANLNYEIRQGTQMKKEGFVTLSQGAPNQGEAKLTVNLAPGAYVVEVFQISQRDGERLHIDNHDITVR
jgi:hypothetical protein